MRASRPSCPCWALARATRLRAPFQAAATGAATQGCTCHHRKEATSLTRWRKCSRKSHRLHSTLASGRNPEAAAKAAARAATRARALGAAKAEGATNSPKRSTASTTSPFARWEAAWSPTRDGVEEGRGR
eukprot:4817113-Pyramimonas_sp.AAC.1